MIRRTNLNRWLIISVFLAGFTPAVAAGGTIYVDDDASIGGNGQTWGTAYKYLQDALADAVSGDDIWVTAGTYFPDEDEGANVTPDDRTATFQLIDSVAIYGGFAGSETGLEERDWVTNETILSGDLLEDDGPGEWEDKGDNSYHVVNGTSNATIDGFTVKAGNANGAGSYGFGGGMYNIGSSPTVTNCTFSGNQAYAGGGMYNCWKSSPMVTNCTFTSNQADDGGGMYNDDNSPTVTNCTFSGNQSDGMYNEDSSPTVTNCTFSGNRWGGMFNISSSPTVTNCIFWGDYGDEIDNVGTSSPVVTYCDIEGSVLPGTGNINVDPLFVDAKGPDNVYGTPDDNLRLSAGSPCIDAGNNTAVPGGVTTDLDEHQRFVDDLATADTGNGTAPIVDMGAYEYSEIRVDASAALGGDGLSWATAYKYLQDGLADAQVSGKNIFVAEGTYYPDEDEAANVTPGVRAETFDLINGVSIYGGFPSGGDPNWFDRDPNVYETILSGDIETVDLNTDNSYHVVTGSGTEPNAVLDGFTVTAGNANGSNPENRGGGMYNDAGSPTIANCTFGGNTAYSGGGMSNRTNSNPTVTNCTFSGNSAGFGGGMENYYNNNPTVTNCTFSGNLASSWGGGMLNSNSSPTVTNCTFGGNTAYSGGGVYNYNTSTPLLTNCILWDNTASIGAQIYDDGTSSTTVSYSDVQGGWAGATNIGDDPLFKDADGPDDTYGTEDDNLQLAYGSPCIDAGDNNSVPADTADLDNDSNTVEPIPLDLAGNARFTDDPVVVDTGNGTAPIVEMGAYERYEFCGSSVFPYPAHDVTGPEGVQDCRIDFYDFANFAAHWLEYTGPE